MLQKFLSKVRKNEKGITGLETAIILIAFVVVAAVFAYTVLSAGLFSTQKSQQAIYSGVAQAQSTIEIKGALVAQAEAGHTGSTGYLSQLTFTVANPVGGEPIDFTSPTGDAAHTGLAASGSNNVVVISYIDANQRVQDLYWTSTELNGNGNNLLEPGEKFQITIGDTVAGAGGGNLADCLDPHLTTHRNFTIEMKTTIGAVLQFQRTTPDYIDRVMTLN